MIWIKGQEVTQAYYSRSELREILLMESTMNFVGYFMLLGDDQATAEDKVGQMSDEAGATLYQYKLGRTQPLKDSINNSVLSFMDTDAKAYLINELTPTV